MSGPNEAPPKRAFLRRLLIGLGILLALIAVTMGVLILVLSKPLPKGETGPHADELARAIERSIDKAAWSRTGAVRWTFAGRNRHLWDRQRSFDRVTWGQVYVLCDLSKKTGIAFRHHQRVTGSAERKLIDRAYASWINDAFWLNPLAKLFDDGVTRSVITAPTQNPEEPPALLISYHGGGLTPGDSYLWLLPALQPGNPQAALRPRAWRMWVSILPIKGIENTWDGWTQLATGAWVATQHQVGGTRIKLELTEVAGAATLQELVPGPDPFALLLGSGDTGLITEGPATPEG